MEKKWNEKKNQAHFFLTQVNSYLPFEAQLRYPLLQEAFSDLPGWFGMILKYYHYVLYVSHSLTTLFYNYLFIFLPN